MKNTTTITTTIRCGALALGLAGCAQSDPVPTAAATSVTTAPAQIAAASVSGPAAMQVPDNHQGDAPMSALSLKWSLARVGEALDVEYTVNNGGSAAVWLLDRTVIPKNDGVHPAYDRASLLAGDTPDLARLVLAHVRPSEGNTVASEYTPGARRLEAGASATGHLSVPLPLVAWNPYLSVAPLPSAPARLVLELGYLTDDPPEGVAAWDAWTPIIGDPALKIPTLSYTVQRQHIVKGEALALP